MGFDWQWDYAIEILPILLGAAVNTLIATLIGFSIALVLGLVFLTGQRTPYRWVNRTVREIMEFIRSTPLLVQVFFLFYVAPQAGIVMSPWVTGMLALGLHYGVYLAEVYRGALYSVPKGQWEACRALNFSPINTYARVILPQALPASIPGMGLYFIGCIKDTPVLSVIAVNELLNAATVLGTTTYRFLEPYTMVAAISLAFTVPLAMGVDAIDRRVRRYGKRAK